MAGPTTGSESAAVEAGRNHGYLQGDPTAGDVCAASVSVTNTDNSYENAFGWQFGGTRVPSFGSFAERFEFTAPAGLCGTVFDLTKLESANDGVMDVYVWEDAAGLPGAVRAMRTGVSPGAVAVWPAFSRHQVELDLDVMDGPFWAGYWGDWPHASANFFITADLDGPGGTPRTNIAPGLEFPSGWQDVSIVWEGTQALGIGVLKLTDLVSVDAESSESEPDTDSNSSGPLAAESAFRAVWPMPSAGETRFSFDLPNPAFVEAVVIDVNGRVVDAIPPVWMEAGVRELVWDGEFANGAAVSPGMYFVRATARDVSGVRTIRGRVLVAR